MDIIASDLPDTLDLLSNCPNDSGPARLALLFADDGNENLPAVSVCAVLEEKESLPCAQLQPAIRDWNGFARSRQNHPNVRRHVVGTFVVVLEILFLRDEFVEEPFQVAPCCGRRIFHQDQTATGVLDESGYDALTHFRCGDDISNAIGYFVGSFASGSELKLFLMDSHEEKRTWQSQRGNIMRAPLY